MSGTRAQREGRLAAARGDAQNPYDSKTQSAEHDAWRDAAAEVNAYRQRGLDPDGHIATVPHTCISSPLNVCTCCIGCRARCYVSSLQAKITARVEKLRRP